MFICVGRKWCYHFFHVKMRMILSFWESTKTVIQKCTNTPLTLPRTGKWTFTFIPFYVIIRMITSFWHSTHTVPWDELYASPSASVVLFISFNLHKIAVVYLAKGKNIFRGTQCLTALNASYFASAPTKDFCHILLRKTSFLSCPLKIPSDFLFMRFSRMLGFQFRSVPVELIRCKQAYYPHTPDCD